MAKQNTDELYAVQSFDVEDLKGLPFRQQITTSIIQYSTNDDYVTRAIIQQAYNNDSRVLFSVHDAGSNLLIPIGANIGHSPGFDAGYILDQGNSVLETLESFAIEEVGELSIDWVLIDVISDWRNPR
jgi:hypothetical protein